MSCAVVPPVVSMTLKERANDFAQQISVLRMTLTVVATALVALSERAECNDEDVALLVGNAYLVDAVADKIKALSA